MEKNKKTYQKTLILVVAGILLNIVGKWFAEFVSAPFWLDSIGTGMVAYVAGPWIGMACGIVSNAGYAFHNLISLPYTLTSAAIGVTVGICARKGLMKDTYSIITTSFVVGIVSVIISSPLNIIFYEGRCGNVWGDGLFDLLSDNGVNASVCAVLAETFIDIPDKILSLLLVCGMIKYGSKRRAKTMVLSALILASLCHASKVQANVINGGDYVPIVYDSENKMASSEANDIVQTPDGYIWVGSYAGLYRYDGKKFTMVGKKQNITNVTVLYVDSKGRLLVGTNDSGIAVYENNKFTLYGIEQGLDVNSIRSIREGENGEIYIGTTGKMALLTEEGTVQPMDHLGEISYVNNLTEEKNGIVAGVTNDGHLFFLKDDEIIYNESIPQGMEGYFTCVYRQNDGTYLVGTSQKKILRYTCEGEKVELEQVTHLAGVTSLRAITADGQGQIWVCADDGFGYLTDADQFVPMLIPEFNNSVEDMVQDYEGNYWFASSRMGVLELTKNRFSDVFAKAGVEDRVVNATCVYDGLLYVATDNGLVAIDEEAKREVTNAMTKRLEGVRVRCLMKDSKNNLWAATYGEEGLLCLADSGEIVAYNEANAGTMGSRFRSVLELSDGSIVAASSSGLSYIKDGRVVAVVGEEDGLTNPQILCLYEMPNGKLLAGSDGDGLFVLENAKVTDCISYENGLPSQIILRICKLKGGYLLVTSNSLCSMDNSGAVRQLQNFPYANNLDAKIDADGNVWVLSSAGIFVVSSDALYNDSTQMSYQLYGSSHGLFTSITANSWNYMDENGKIYLSCANGVKTVETKITKELVNEYKLALNSVSGEQGEILPSEDAVYSMSRTDKRIEIEPVVLNYTLSRPYVRYCLEGFDENPVIVRQDELDVIAYTNIPSGTYRFRFAVLDEYTMEPLKEMVITLNKEKQFYEHGWFYAYLIFVILFLVAFLTWTLTRISSIEVIRSQYEQIRAAKEEADRANSAKSMFLANMSHEIRTPMNAVIGMSEIALKEDVSESVRDHLMDILGASRKLLGTINDILDFSKIESGKMEIVGADYSLHAMVKGVVNIISFRLEEKPIQLVVDVENEIPDNLYGDEIRIRQILINLLNNAVKFTSEGTITLTVRQKKEESKMLLCFAVEDTGCGIRPEDKERLFDSFERVEADGLHKVEGTGLGLSICKNMVGLMGGHIWVESVYGKGTTFYVEIPQIVTDDSKSYADALEAEKEGARDIAENEKWTFAGAKILVVDDDKVNLKVAKGLMDDYELEIDLAESGEECLQKVRENQYDIIFMDHLMPQMDGIQTLNKLKEDPGFAMPVIMLTANAIVGVDQMYREKGFSDYLSKPMEQKEIFRILSVFLEGYKKARQKPEKQVVQKESEIDTGSMQKGNTIASDFLTQLEEEGIHTEEAMRFMGNDEAQYAEILQMFVEDSAQKKDKLQCFFEEKNWKEYGILVHALKSNMRSLGADELAERAFALEKAAKAGDAGFVDENHEEFLFQWQMLLVGLKYIPRLGVVKAILQQKEEALESVATAEEVEGEVLGQEYRMLAEEIADLVDDFETDAAKEKLEALSEMKLSKEQKAQVQRAQKALRDYDYDSVIKILKE